MVRSQASGMSMVIKTVRIRTGQADTLQEIQHIALEEPDPTVDRAADATKPLTLVRLHPSDVLSETDEPGARQPQTRQPFRNLRHLRLFLQVLDGNSVRRAASTCSLSQPAATQAIAKLESGAGLSLFRRTPQGLFATEAGLVLGQRVQRALSRLDAAAQKVSPRLVVTATSSQLRSLIAVSDAKNFTLAARWLGITPASVHRTVSDLEDAAGVILLERTAHGLIVTRACRALADAARLAFAELDQAEMELAELGGREVGRIVVGATALAQSAILPRAIAEFRRARPLLPLCVREMSYDQFLGALRHGEIDFLITALRSPAPIGDVVQTPLFQDNHVVVAGPHHPLVGRKGLTASELRSFPFVVSEAPTPIRASFEAFFGSQDVPVPTSLVESGSLILMRQLLAATDYLGWVSEVRAATEIEHGLLVKLDVASGGFSTPIGLTTRLDWLPTLAQQAFLDCVMDATSTPPEANGTRSCLESSMSAPLRTTL